MIYMYALPHAPGSRWAGRTIDGCLVYRAGIRKPIPANAIDENFRNRLFTLLRRVVAKDYSRRGQSERDCSWVRPDRRRLPGAN